MLPKGEELKKILKQASEQAKSEAKESGASIYYIEDGKRIREEASGQKFEIIYDENGKREEPVHNG
jgi:gas vesicle protein